jgi:hypothetical protein
MGCRDGVRCGVSLSLVSIRSPRCSFATRLFATRLFVRSSAETPVPLNCPTRHRRTAHFWAAYRWAAFPRISSYRLRLPEFANGFIHARSRPSVCACSFAPARLRLLVCAFSFTCLCSCRSARNLQRYLGAALPGALRWQRARQIGTGRGRVPDRPLLHPEWPGAIPSVADALA